FTSVGCDATGGTAPFVISSQRYHYTLGACTTPTPTPCGLGSWSAVANYPAVIESPAVSTNGTFAYSAAGNVSGAATNGLYRYDPVGNIWTTLASLPASLYATRSVY